MPFDRYSHCSLGDDRNWTDPISNWTAVSGGQPFRDLQWFTVRGRLPNPLFGPFVHELTHHWCFHSPVGAALAYLHQRANRCARHVSGLDPRSDEFHYGADSIVDDLTRIEIALKLMRPLAEGLAQFAEFDVQIGNSQVITEVSASILRTFWPTNEPLPTETEDIFGRLAELIAGHRLSSELLARKKDLLVSPFDCSGGGYLAGYMLVRNLHMALIRQRQCERLLDKDLLLGFLRCFFYEDYAFVNTLLDPSRSDFEAAQAVSVYFQNRLSTLAMAASDETVSAYETFVLEQQTLPPATRDQPQLLSPAEEVAAGRKRLGELRAQIDAAGTPESHLTMDEAWTFAQRSVMCVGRFVDRVEVTSNGFVRAIQNTEMLTEPLWFALSMGALPGSREQKGQGTISFFLCFLPEQHRAVTIHLDGQLVGVGVFPQDLPENLKEQFTSYQTAFDRAKDERLRSRETITRILETSGRADEVTYYQEQIAHLTSEFYASRALLYTSDDKLEIARAMLQDDGLVEVLEGDFASIEALAQLSLCNSLSWDKVFLEECMAVAGVDLNALVNKLELCKERSGVPLVHDFDKNLYVYV